MFSLLLPGFAVILVSAPGLFSQEKRAEHPAVDIIDQVENLLNENSEAVITGTNVISSDSLHYGDIIVVNGSVVVSGKIVGDITVVDGDLSLRGQAEVVGRVLVLGGKAFSSKLARVQGGFEVYDYRLKVTRKGKNYYITRTEDGENGFMKLELRGFKGLGVGPYNRVDGLPLLLHVKIDDAGSKEKWGLSLKGIYRIAAHRWGWDIFWESRKVWKLSRVGAGYSSKAVTNDRFKVSDFENTIAAFLFKEDFRNYYEKRAFEGWFEVIPVKSLSLGFEFETAENKSLETMAELSLFGWSKHFGTNPPVEAGRSNSVSFFVTHDTRDNEDNPEIGWYSTVTLERAGGSLGGDFTFTRYEADLRRYNRFGYRSHLDLRLFLQYGDERLPAIRHLTFGGIGALRGHPDSMAGFERVLLASADFRYMVTSGISHSIFYRDGMDLVLFCDAGRSVAWPAEINMKDLDADIGVGVTGSGFLSYLGVFVAKSVTDTDLDPRVTVRVEKDF